MSIKYGTAAGAALFVFALILVPALAANVITEREKHDCPNDYHKYCGDYGLGTEALRACMSRNIKKISNVCVAALVDAGELTQAQADKLRAKAPTVKKKKTTTKKKVAHKTTTHKTTTHKTTAHKTAKQKTP
jgi:hypothetical protein